jgi:hypothetical protein
LRNLEHENQLLRDLVKDMATLITETFESMSPEIQELENVRRLLDTTRNIISHINLMEEYSGPPISTSDNRQ